jgi:hypothetical protein
MQPPLALRRRALALGAGLVALLVAAPAAAFCGFYVKDREVEELKSGASRAVLLRDGTTTVLSMQSSYEGPVEDFALVVPVPSAIGPEDVRTLDDEVFERLDELTSPRLVEYWEQEPMCPSAGGLGFGTIGYGRGGGIGGVVTIEAQFAVGEYDVVVLGADESQGLVRWLEAEGYQLPRGAEAVLRPYVERGMRFFAAKVDVDRVRFDNGRALLSPLRIRYDSERLALPIRLGTLASPGKQDLVVHVISRQGRYEVANRPNVRVPTNLEVRAATKGRFRAFYESLLDHVWRQEPTAVVTEYAWSATSCDPCPGPTMSADDITTFGGDLISGAREQTLGRGFAIERPEVYEGPLLPRARISHALQARVTELFECVESPVRVGLTLTVADDGAVESTLGGGDERTRACLGRALEDLSVSRAGLRAGVVRVKTGLFLNQRIRRYLPSAQGFTVTRLRARYGREAPDDLIFRRAPAIAGGIGEPDQDGDLDPSIRQSSTNTFQARYAVLHRWSRNRCEGWMSGGWGGPPGSDDEEVVQGAPGLVPRRRRPVSLRRLLRGPLPRLGAARMSVPEHRRLASLGTPALASRAMLVPWSSPR